MTVRRMRPLPRGTLRGRYEISANLIPETRRALLAFHDAGRHEGGHEGICFWAGREEFGVTRLKAVVVPDACHHQFGVFVSAEEFGAVARRARALRLGILAQVHSHPESDTRHSDGDDDLIIMPFENMLSLVAPYYGRMLLSIADFSVHQFQDRRWVLCDSEPVAHAFKVDAL